MEPSRRDLLRILLGAGVAGLSGPGWAAGATPVPPVPSRIGLLLPTGAAADGASLAGEEARQTARLLGRDLELVTSRTGAQALVGEAAPAEQTRALFLSTGPAADGVRPRVFHLSSSPARRRKAEAGRKGVRVVDWHPDLMRFGAEQLNDRFRRRFARPMSEEAWHGWMAVKVAAELALRAAGSSPADFARTLPTLRFDGHKGTPLGFGAGDHHLVQPVYRVDARGKLLGEVA